MILKMACCFTGHRPAKLPWGYDESNTACKKLKKELAFWITKLIEFGVTDFYTGMAMGVDIWVAEIILNLKKEYQNRDIKLTAVIPYEGQQSKWTDEWKKRYSDILKSADSKIVLQQQYTKDCLHARNRFMVDKSSFIIAVFNGEEGGTKYTIEYARKKQLRIKIIDPQQFI